MQDDDVIGRLGARRGGEPAFLGAHHLLAAQRFERLVQKAMLTPRVTMSYDPTHVGGLRGGGNGVAVASDTAAEARSRLNALAGRMPGDCWGVLFDICAMGKGLQFIETERGWPRRSAKLVLRIALDHLAGLFGLDAQGRGRETGGTTAWLEARLPIIPERSA